jgi:hypothetical protein
LTPNPKKRGKSVKYVLYLEGLEIDFAGISDILP